MEQANLPIWPVPSHALLSHSPYNMCTLGLINCLDSRHNLYVEVPNLPSKFLLLSTANLILDLILGSGSVLESATPAIEITCVSIHMEASYKLAEEKEHDLHVCVCLF